MLLLTIFISSNQTIPKNLNIQIYCFSHFESFRLISEHSDLNVST